MSERDTVSMLAPPASVNCAGWRLQLDSRWRGSLPFLQLFIVFPVFFPVSEELEGTLLHRRYSGGQENMKICITPPITREMGRKPTENAAGNPKDINCWQECAEI